MVFIGNPTYTPDKRLLPEKPVLQIVVTIERQRRGADQANATLIVQAVNEYDALKSELCAARTRNSELVQEITALNAVARAAEVYFIDKTDHAKQMALVETLANLAEVRKLNGVV